MLLHPKKRVTSMLRHVAELLDVAFRVRIELGETFECSHVRDNLLQKLDGRLHWRPFLRLVDRWKLYDLLKLVRKSKLLSLRRSPRLIAIYDASRYYF
jgi:hypothetical protein